MINTFKISQFVDIQFEIRSNLHLANGDMLDPTALEDNYGDGMYSLSVFAETDSLGIFLNCFLLSLLLEIGVFFKIT